MKKISIISLLLMALASCQVAELTAPVEEYAPVTEQALFYVGMEEDVDTKTSSTLEGDIFWSTGDKMNIFYGLNNDNKDFIELKGGEGTKNGKFYGPYIVVGENQLQDLHQTVIVYPFDENTTCVANESKTEYTVSLTIPSVQNYAKDSFGNGAYPMVGVTETPKELVVETKNVASVINFRIKGTASISKIVLSSDEAALAGPTTVVTSYGNVPVATVDDATGSKSIELVCDGVQLNSETATNFNIVLAPYTGVVKVTIYDTNGGYTVRTLPERVYKRGGRVNFNHTFAAEHSIIDELKAAFKNGGEYTLPVDVTVTEQLLISGANKKLNLDLNGNTLTCNTNLTGTSGSIQTTGAELNISNGTIVNKAGYFFVTNGYNDNLHLELTDVDVKGSATAVFYFADGTDIVLNTVNVNVSGKGFKSYSKKHNGTILINGGTYKTSGKIFDFTSNLPVTFLGDCLFSDASYEGAQWVESGDAAYPWKPVGHNVLVGTKGYYSLSEAVAAVEKSATITITSDFEMTESVEIPAGKSIVLDLAGHTLSQTTDCAGHSMIVNKGDLTLKGEGTIRYTYNGTPDSTYGKGNQTISNFGTLVLDGPTVENATAKMSHAFFAIDTREGATFNVVSGAVRCENATAVRMGQFGAAANELNISGGHIYGGRAVQMHLPSSSATVNPVMTLNVQGGVLETNEETYNIGIYVLSNGQSAENVTVTIGGEAQIKGSVLVNANATNSMKSAAIQITGGAITGTYGVYSYSKDEAKADDVISVTGGTFDVYPNYVDAEYKVDEQNGKYAVVAKPAVAMIGEKGYLTLNAAVAAVEDGQTITLASDEVFTKDNRCNNSGYWDGLAYSGDKSFTIDLGGYTIKQDGSLNDYLMWVKNDGAKANTITLKNGTMDAGTTAYSAFATASSNKQKITVNLENIKLINNISNGAVVKARGGSELNVKAGTIITGMDSYTGIEAVGNNTVVNIYDGAEIYQNGTSNYVGAIVGASYNSTLNIYGGKGKSAKCGIIVMSTGATINVSGGEWTANGDGTVAGDNNGVLVSQNNRYESGWACKSILNVTGGTFKGGYNCYGMGPGVEADDAQIHISGGNFNANPSAYVENGYKAVEANGVWDIVIDPAVQIGGTEYDTLQEALAVGGEIVLLRDVTVTEPVTLEDGKTAVLDLNGKTLIAPSSSAIVSKEGSTLTVKNGKVVAYESTVRAVGGKAIVESGEYTSTGTALDSPATYRYSLDCREGGELIINGGTFKSNNGMINVSSTVTVNGGKFENIVEKAMTRHFAYVSAPLTINDGEFYGKANGAAGGCFFCGAAAGCDIKVNGGRFTSLWTSGSVNRIFEVYYGGTINVTGGMFNTNGGIANFVVANTDEATKGAYPYVAK